MWCVCTRVCVEVKGQLVGSLLSPSTLVCWALQPGLHLVLLTILMSLEILNWNWQSPALSSPHLPLLWHAWTCRALLRCHILLTLELLALCLRGFLGYRAILYIILVLQRLPILSQLTSMILFRSAGDEIRAVLSPLPLYPFFSTICLLSFCLRQGLAVAQAGMFSAHTYTYCSYDKSFSWIPDSRTSVTLPDSHRP